MNEAKTLPLLSPRRLWSINICLNNKGNAVRNAHSGFQGAI